MKSIIKFFGAVAVLSLAVSESAQACLIGIDPSCHAVPEPSSWSLVALGLVGVVAAARFFKK